MQVTAVTVYNKSTPSEQSTIYVETPSMDEAVENVLTTIPEGVIDYGYAISGRLVTGINASICRGGYTNAENFNRFIGSIG